MSEYEHIQKKNRVSQDIISKIRGLARSLVLNYCPNLRWQAIINSFMRLFQFEFISTVFSEHILIIDFMKTFWLLLLIKF